MPCGCLLVVLAIALVFGGVGGLRDAARFRKPITMTCEQFLKAPPIEGWYHLTGCSVELGDGVCETSHYSFSHSDTEKANPETDTISAVEIPVYSLSSDHKPTTLMLRATDATSIRLMTEGRALKKAEPEARLKWFQANRDKLYMKRDVTGMIREASHSGAVDKEEQDTFAPGYVEMEEGGKPETPTSSIGMILAGLVVGAISLLYWISVFLPRNRGDNG